MCMCAQVASWFDDVLNYSAFSLPVAKEELSRHPRCTPSAHQATFSLPGCP